MHVKVIKKKTTTTYQMEEKEEVRKEVPEERPLPKEKERAFTIVNGEKVYFDPLTPREDAPLPPPVPKPVVEKKVLGSEEVHHLFLRELENRQILRLTSNLLSIVLVGFLLKLFLPKKKSLVLEYHLDEEATKQYEDLKNLFLLCNDSEKLQMIEKEKDLTKHLRGTTLLPKLYRYPVHFEVTTENRYFTVNIPVLTLSSSYQDCFFLPDGLLVIRGSDVYSFPYEEMMLTLSNQSVLENGPMPKDNEVEYYSWLKVDAAGNPKWKGDGNPQLPVYQYKKLVYQKEGVWALVLLLSNKEKIAELNEQYEVWKDTYYR